SISSVLTSANVVLQSSPSPVVVGTATSVIAMIALAAKLQKRRIATTTTQKTLDAMPDAIALFDNSGKLTALNQKLARLMPLKIEPKAFSTTDTNCLYEQISPDAVALERARNRARAVANDPNSTISFEAPSYGSRSLLVKERRTRDGGVSVSVYGSINPAQHRLSDPLTALANRTRLVHELAQRCSRSKNELSLIIVDLRSFRQINDTYGREAGDELLKQTANCLLHIMPEDSLIARTAGDEFAVLLESDLGRPAIEKLLQGLLRTLRSGLPVSDMNVPVRASVGIAYAPEHGNTVSSLLKSADSACAQAKQGTENALVVFNSAQQQQAKHRHQLEIGLQQALKKKELSLQYQPQIDIKSKMTCGMEALLRWESAKFGKVSPVDFIPVAEETGIINHLGTWVLNQAVKDYQRLARYGMSPAMLSVNLSRKQFEGGRIVSDVERLLYSTNFDPAKLCLEITETSLSSDSKKLREQLLDLTSLGVRLAIDDFGVGYSSLLELRDYPISEVKIDRAFIMDIATNANSQDFVHAIVDISRSIGAEVVAEGIENQQQFDMVDQLGCDRAQGYYLCEPMAATTFPDVVLSA
ncbi:MAG: diguanylate cyclase (GGDEF)-like protein, partial [Flavobacteriaceae bacterium]